MVTENLPALGTTASCVSPKMWTEGLMGLIQDNTKAHRHAHNIEWDIEKKQHRHIHTTREGRGRRADRDSLSFSVSLSLTLRASSEDSLSPLHLSRSQTDKKECTETE